MKSLFRTVLFSSCILFSFLVLYWRRIEDWGSGVTSLAQPSLGIRLSDGPLAQPTTSPLPQFSLWPPNLPYPTTCRPFLILEGPVIPEIIDEEHPSKQVGNSSNPEKRRKHPLFLKWKHSHHHKHDGVGHNGKRRGAVQNYSAATEEESIARRFGIEDKQYLGASDVSTCEEIRSRGYYPTEPLSGEEASFPIAFANIVYRDYIMLERVLATVYQPQNLYCYSLDVKADPVFKQRMRRLTECFAENVVVPEEEYNTTSNGDNYSISYLACMKALKRFDWKYLILMHNQDLPLRTNAELVRIAHILNGSNVLGTIKPGKGNYNEKGNYTFAHLHLYRDEAKNRNQLHSLRPTKGLDEVILSRPFVDFIIDELDVNGFLCELERGVHYGVDENFYPTLNSDNVLKAPGGFTHACMDRGFNLGGIVRYTLWQGQEKDPAEGDDIDICGRANEPWHFRHSICLFGLEDLHRLTTQQRLVANKFWPASDYGAVHCWLEWIYNRTHFPALTNSNDYDEFLLDEAFFAEFPHVRFNRLSESEKDEVRTSPKGERAKKLFDCSGPAVETKQEENTSEQ